MKRFAKFSISALVAFIMVPGLAMAADLPPAPPSPTLPPPGSVTSSHTKPNENEVENTTGDNTELTAEAKAKLIKTLQAQIALLTQKIQALVKARQSGISTPPPTPSTPSITPTPQTTCLSLQNRLEIGASDATKAGEVSQVQRFLKSKGYYTYPEITGYFGTVTAGALTQFQLNTGIIASTAQQHGDVGPKTRAVIMKVSCGSGTK